MMHMEKIMPNFIEYYEADKMRYGAKPDREQLMFCYFFRKAQCYSNRLLKLVYRALLYRYCTKRGLKISWRTQIGKGFYIGHPYAITINENAVLGKNVNIHKGATIGQTNRGSTKGVPTVGDNVWIGINSIIVGNIRVVNDVLIAPGAYVNFDVPDHSIVIGNPGRIISSDHATEGYINNTI